MNLGKNEFEFVHHRRIDHLLNIYQKDNVTAMNLGKNEFEFVHHRRIDPGCNENSHRGQEAVEWFCTIQKHFLDEVVLIFYNIMISFRQVHKRRNDDQKHGVDEKDLVEAAEKVDRLVL